MENGFIVTKPALSEKEIMSFEEVGELEAFNTDGLRSLIYTMGHIPDMKEKTRLPQLVKTILATKDKIVRRNYINTGAGRVQHFIDQ